MSTLKTKNIDNAYAAGDNAGKYRQTQSEKVKLIPEHVTRADLKQVEKNGYIVIENVLSSDEITTVKNAILPLLNETGRNSFEGYKTQRLYGVLNKTRALDRLVDHPRILALLDKLFMPNYLLSQLQVINLLPGESGQPLHFDDGFYPISRPRAPLGAATIWAIDDFTQSNGATVIVPNSHTWDDNQKPTAEQAKSAVMKAGSVLFYPGTFWHGGGANHSSGNRLAVTCQYCEPWLRTQENYFLGTPLNVVADLSEDIRRMLGFSIHPPFIGMVNGMHPKRLLENM
ncbi:Phytanoyl-CoA dioxygenase [Paraglaciecola sp. T6c]|uniref:phytanoyl-CoA dioxygenase family protein n=1 Tax=Pseudoalteromonas atlantica (strain T6c / ATCC BAA-1087) TaxID=3042615 RepID=UPI00005C712E|nr:phytanoyl-CoA dioxygenase family protein [Paraglaciecola sp. T6c]ABG42272.1 Phytanoyl-CoA dioxygenase [Paraglaciecola sp. T6c]